jgi:putative peptide zinc metalloprotease protein
VDDRAGAAEANLRALSVQDQLQHLDRILARQIIRVPSNVKGTVLSPPKPNKLGSFLRQGEQFCTIGDPKKLEAYIVVEHSDRSLLAKGQSVWVKVNGQVGPIKESVIREIADRELMEVPPMLSNKIDGGEVATTTGEQKSDQARQPPERPAVPSYAIRVEFGSEDPRYVLGVRGTARVDVGYRSLAWRLQRYLQQTFNFRL